MTTSTQADDARYRLAELLSKREDEGVLVATSGGVDSCTLAALAHEELGEAMLAVTLNAESSARREVEDAVAFAEEQGIRHEVVEHSELDDPDYRENTPSRCYYCRDGMTDRLAEVAEREGLSHVAMGYVPDDRMDHTPGRRAALESGAWFPYVDADVGKDEVRVIAEAMDLPVADRPSNACLSSRVPYGSEVTGDKLADVEAAEAAVRRIVGVEQVRVRHHGDVARVEVPPPDRSRLLDHAEDVSEALREVGFTFVAMDLLGYRTGAMNEALQA